MAIVYLSMGSNLEDRNLYLDKARQAIKRVFTGARFSRIYETEPVDFENQPWFLNQVAEIQTDLTPISLLEWLQGLENQLGRQRKFFKGPRTLDIDILLYGDLIVEEVKIVLPHPRLEYRRHVLIPLEELAPDAVLPVSRRSVKEALKDVNDPARVILYAPT